MGNLPKMHEFSGSLSDPPQTQPLKWTRGRWDWALPCTDWRVPDECGGASGDAGCAVVLCGEVARAQVHPGDRTALRALGRRSRCGNPSSIHTVILVESYKRCHMAASSKDLTVALIVVGIVFFYRLNALAVSMTRYYESHTNKDRR